MAQRIPARGRAALRVVSRPLGLAAAVLVVAACAASTSSAPVMDVAGHADFASGEVLHYSLHGDQDRLVGNGVFTTHVEGDTYVLEQTYTEAAALVPAGQQPTTDVVTVTVRRDTLKPLSGTREVDQRTDTGRSHESYAWQYTTDKDGHPVLDSTHTKDGKSEQRTLRLRDHYYDNESSLWLWRTVAYRDGYEQQYVSVNPSENSQQTVDVRAPLQQPVDVPAGAFTAWRLLIRNGRAVRTAWVDGAGAHTVVQWDNGDVVFRLEP